MSYKAHIKSHTGGANMSITAPDGTPANRCAEQQECDITQSKHHCWLSRIMLLLNLENSLWIS